MGGKSLQQVLFEQKSFFRKRAVILGSYQFWQLSPLRPPEFMFLSVSEYADSASATNCLSVFDHFVELALKGLNWDYLFIPLSLDCYKLLHNLTQKPVTWFAVQIKWLVYIWGQHWHLMSYITKHFDGVGKCKKLWQKQFATDLKF